MSHPHPELSTPAPLQPGALRIVPLGGLGEIGRNMTVFEYDGRLLIVSRPSFADVVALSLRTGRIRWRFPVAGQEIKNEAQLIVRESQAAVFLLGATSVSQADPDEVPGPPPAAGARRVSSGSSRSGG